MSEAGIKGRTILITGGTGSFGQAATQRLLEAGCDELRIFSRDELKQSQMRDRLRSSRLKFYLGDVREPAGLVAAMRGTDYVFHAAALKQVPSCEFFPIQAVSTNVVGTQNVIEAGSLCGVERIVCLSTDKAVYPVNAMGLSKALSEKIAQASARQRESDAPVVVVVRYGNVLYSRGSVLPLFVDQIRAGQPMTITDPRMTRFLLGLPDAVELVLYALTTGRPGDLFVRRAPACTIADLATAVGNLLGASLPPVRIGVRHGEKMFETLATREELSRSRSEGEFIRVEMDDRDLNYSKYFDKGDLDDLELEDYTSENCTRLGVAELETLLAEVPELRRELPRN